MFAALVGLRNLHAPPVLNLSVEDKLTAIGNGDLRSKQFIRDIVDRHFCNSGARWTLQQWHNEVSAHLLCNTPARIGALRVLASIDFTLGIIPRGPSSVFDKYVISNLESGTSVIKDPNSVQELSAVAGGILSLFGKKANKDIDLNSGRESFHIPSPEHFQSIVTCLSGEIDQSTANHLINLLETYAQISVSKLQYINYPLNVAVENSVHSLCQIVHAGSSAKTRDRAESALHSVIPRLIAHPNVARGAALGLPLLVKDSSDVASWASEMLVRLSNITEAEIAMPNSQTKFGSWQAKEIVGIVRLGIVRMLGELSDDTRVSDKLLSSLKSSDIENALITDKLPAESIRQVISRLKSLTETDLHRVDTFFKPANYQPGFVMTFPVYFRSEWVTPSPSLSIATASVNLLHDLVKSKDSRLSSPALAAVLELQLSLPKAEENIDSQRRKDLAHISELLHEASSLV